ncbi:MAG TPA: DoxX family protein [Puia sp.]|nr:DoxX family protein [Puia sp.]
MKYKKISYWVLTVVFAGMMTLSSVLYLSHAPALVQAFHSLGYPDYMLNILGTAKFIGVIALVQTRFSVLKEWAYAGFTINLIGAAWSHLSVGQPIVMPFVLLVVLLGSYFLWKRAVKNVPAEAEKKIRGFAL